MTTLTQKVNDIGEEPEFTRGQSIVSQQKDNRPILARRSSTFHNQSSTFNFLRDPTAIKEQENDSSSFSRASDIEEEIDVLKKKIDVIGENQQKQQQSIELILSKFDTLINNYKNKKQ